MKLQPTTILITLFFLFSLNVHARPAPSEESLKATFYKIRDAIRISCNKEYPTDDKKFQECASTRDSSMVWFFTTLYNYRDRKGINSIEFKKGIDCSELYSPSVNEPGRKKALELADWIKVKSCYLNALSK